MYFYGRRATGLLDADELALCGWSEIAVQRTTVLTKRQSGVARNLRRAAFLAVGEPRRNDEETLASNLHTRDTLVPSLNHLSVTQTECKLWYHTRQHT